MEPEISAQTGRHCAEGVKGEALDRAQSAAAVEPATTAGPAAAVEPGTRAGPAAAAEPAPAAEPVVPDAGTGVSRRRILMLAWPAILEMSLHMLVWIIDTAVVGRLGAEALSAVGLGGQVYFTVFFAVGALGVGTTALVARHIGAGEHESGIKVATQAVALAVILGMAVMVLGQTLAAGIYAVAGLGPPTSSLGTTYVRLISLGAPFIMVQLVANGAFRGQGDTGTPLRVAAAANFLNVVGDYVLVFGLVGFPALGVRGAALASLMAQVLGGVLSLFLFLRRGGFRILGRYGLRPDAGVLKRLVRLSLPAAGEVLLMDGARTVNSFVIAGLGAVSLAANQVAVAAESLSFMPGYGLAIAASILVGQCLGAGAPSRAEEAARKSLGMAVAVMGMMGALFALFPEFFVRVFTIDTAVIPLAVVCLRIGGLTQPFVAITDILTGSLRGAGDTRTALKITALGAWGLRVPLTFLVVYILGLPLWVAWMVAMLEWGVRAVVSTLYFRRGRWKDIAI